MRVLAFTGGHTISSARYRVRQLIGPLSKEAIVVTEYIAKYSSWPPPCKWIRPFWFLLTLAQRLPGIVTSRSYDLTILQREMVSTFVTLEGFTRRPRVIDIDDAVWLHQRGHNFKHLLRMCDAAVCGNTFLADHVSQVTPEVLVLPTLVDSMRFKPAHDMKETKSRPIIGWSGLHSGSKYLLAIEKPLKIVLEKYPDALLRIVSDKAPDLSAIPKHRMQFVRWSPEDSVEVGSLQDMTVGLMPIDDTLWSRGKCSYKMLLYMACGIPVVVSPYGMNSEVLSKGMVGFGAKSDDQWVEAISALIENSSLGQTLGANGRSVVLEHYSISSQLPLFVNFLRKVRNG